MYRLSLPLFVLNSFIYLDNLSGKGMFSLSDQCMDCVVVFEGYIVIEHPNFNLE